MTPWALGPQYVTPTDRPTGPEGRRYKKSTYVTYHIFWFFPLVRAALRYRRTHARRKINHFAGDMLDTLLQKAGKHEVVLVCCCGSDRMWGRQ